MENLLVNVKNRLVAFLNTRFRLFGTPVLGQVQTARKEVDPATEIRLRPPVTVGKALHWKFRKHLRVFYPATFVTTLSEARVWGNQGAVITRDNIFFDEVSREFEGTGPDHSLFKQWKIHPRTPLPGTSAVLATAGNEVYYHWMFDILPRIEILQKSGLFSYIDCFILNYRRLPFQLETLALAGLPEEKILQSTNHWHFHVEAETLVVPSLVSPNDCPSAEACAYLRRLFAPAMRPAPPFRKIYIQRTSGRRLLNEEAVLPILEEEGFEIIRPESSSVADQVKLFSEASWVIGPHGAGLTNLVFCHPGTKVIDLFSPEWVNPCYWILSHHLQLQYGYLIGQGKESPEGVDPQNKAAHITVDPVQLKELLQRLAQPGVATA